VFDAEASLNIAGDSGPYLQYTHARFRSILRKIADSKKKIPVAVKMSPLERQLATAILHFSEVVQDAANSFSPNTLAGYLRDTAMLANEFYHSHPVAQEKDKLKQQFRVSISELTATILKQGLNILGISALEKM
jgi:arginyl-tRNA synthetase